MRRPIHLQFLRRVAAVFAHILGEVPYCVICNSLGMKNAKIQCVVDYNLARISNSEIFASLIDAPQVDERDHLSTQLHAPKV